MFEVVHPTRAVVHNREQQDDDEEHGAEISCQYNVSVLHQIIHQKKLLVSSILFSYQKWKWGGPVQKIMRTNLIYCQQSLQNRPGLCPSISSTSSQNLNLMWRMICAIFDHASCWSWSFLAKSITCWLRRTRRHQRLRWRRQRELECPTQTSGEKLIIHRYIDINPLHENNKIDAY